MAANRVDMSPSVRVVLGFDPGDLRSDMVAAFGISNLLVAHSSRALLLQLTGIRVSTTRSVVLDAAVTSVGLSPSGRHILTVDAKQCRVWDREGAEPHLVLDRAAKTSVGATFCRLRGAEAVLHEPGQAELDAFDLSDGRCVFDGNTETFRMDSAFALAGGTHIALLGYYRGEGKSSLVVVPTDELAEPPDVIFMRFRKKRPVADYAYSLGVGPAGIDALVVYRDPEDDEEPDDDDDALHDPVAHADVRGHHGFYVRGLDGVVRGRLAWTGPISQYARLAAAPPWIAAECGDRVALVSLDGAPSSMIDARWLASSPDGSQVLVQQRDLQLAIIHLAP